MLEGHFGMKASQRFSDILLEPLKGAPTKTLGSHDSSQRPFQGSISGFRSRAWMQRPLGQRWTSPVFLGLDHLLKLAVYVVNLFWNVFLDAKLPENE